MGAMKELAIELEQHWHRDTVSHFDSYARTLPSGELAVILYGETMTGETAYLFVAGGMAGQFEHLHEALAAAGEVARQQLGEREGWAA